MSAWFRAILWHFVRCGSATDELDGESRWPAVKLSVTALLTSVLRHRRRPQQLQQQPPHHHSRYRSAHTLLYPVRSGSFNFGHILRVQISSYLTRLCIKQNCFPVDNIETFKILNGNYTAWIKICYLQRMMAEDGDNPESYLKDGVDWLLENLF